MIRFVFVLVLMALPLAAQFKSRSQLVEVYATVYDHAGVPVPGLDKDSFQVLDNGVQQPILHFEPSGADLSCALLLDTTGSMKDALGGVRNAVSNLLDQMREGDSAAVFTFNSSLNILQDFTTDKSLAKRAVMRTRAAGETALFDAIAEASRTIGPRSGKKAIVLFTDGADNASHIRAEGAIRRALTTGVPIYAVAEGSAVHEGALLKELRSLSERTGGKCYRAQSSKDVNKVFAQIEMELKHVYLLTYKPPEAEESKWRTIQVSVKGGKQYQIRGKQGYFPE